MEKSSDGKPLSWNVMPDKDLREKILSGIPRYAEGKYSNFFYDYHEIEEIVFRERDKRVDPDVRQSFNSIKYTK